MSKQSGQDILEEIQGVIQDWWEGGHPGISPSRLSFSLPNLSVFSAFNLVMKPWNWACFFYV